MRKEFLSYQAVRNNAIKLGHRIHGEGFFPDVIYVSLRGGAYMGNVLSEYFKLKRRDRKKFIGIRGVPRPKPHPLFRITSGGIEDWERNPGAARKFT